MKKIHNPHHDHVQFITIHARYHSGTVFAWTAENLFLWEKSFNGAEEEELTYMCSLTHYESHITMRLRGWTDNTEEKEI